MSLNTAGPHACMHAQAGVCCLCLWLARATSTVQALISSPLADPDAARRVDLTHLAVFTIDDASTRDYDDGISVEQAADGQLLLWVHVADPTRYLQPGADTRQRCA